MENKQDLRWLGVWIKLERLKRNWSQEGLCHGLCAVSYLSKIEQGKVPAPNPDLMRLLCKRLDGATPPPWRRWKAGWRKCTTPS